MKLIIPTYRRDKQTTFSHFSKESRANTIFVVDERDKRRIGFMGVTDDQIWVHPPEIDSIAKKRAWILRECFARNIGKIMMFDDDLRFAYRPAWGETSLKPATPDVIDGGMYQVSKLLDEFAHVGLGPRQGNNNAKEPIQSTGRMMYALGYNIPWIVNECELGRIDTREDMDYCLQLLRKGFDNRVLHTLVVDQSYNAPGGCHDQRTVESSNADAEKLAALHPGLVKVVEKPYKGSVPRKEVIVQWKKALNAG